MYFLWFSVVLLVVSGNLAEYDLFPAAQGQFPFQALIIHSNFESSGALISIQHVLTTARAVKSLEQGVVILAAGILEEEQVRQNFEINKTNVIVHEKFDDGTHRNNIALITLPQAVKLTAYVGPVKLPAKTDSKQNHGGQRVYIIGFQNSLDGSRYLSYIEDDLSEGCAVDFNATADQAICTLKPMQFLPVKNDEGASVVLKYPKNKTLIGLMTNQDVEESDIWNLGVRVSVFIGWINERLRLEV